METTTGEAIPLQIALKLCSEIRGEADRNWHTASARWCWECRQSGGDDPDRRGFMRMPGNRGCVLINRRYSLIMQ
jgi:hypothetical protein